MSAKSNPLDRATVADWRAWITANAKWLIVVAGLFGYNVLQPDPELPPIIPQKEVQFTSEEFTQLVSGMQLACGLELEKITTKKATKWRQKK